MQHRVLFLCVVLTGCGTAATHAPVCGDGVINAGELCDGADVRDVSCEALGFGMGVVRCNSTCDRLDVSRCSAAPGFIDAGTVPGVDAGLDAGVMVEDAGTSVVDAGPSRLLHVQGSRFATPDGALVEVRGAISCCGGGYGWPLVDDAWMDLVASHGANFLHVRLGPFLTTTPDGETDWSSIGGGYVESAGVADLTRFNDTFWNKVREILERARVRGLWVEVDVIDGWALKHCQWGDLQGYSAWDPAFNAQQLDGCNGAGGAAIVPGSVQDLWVRKVVRETGRFDHVIYEDGNEIGLVANYATAWSTSLAAIIHDEERVQGLSRHLVGTNSGSMQTMGNGALDFAELHQGTAPTLASCAGKPCGVNEYNPNPPLTPQQFQQRFCAARGNGTAFWYWRHGQDDAALDASLSKLTEPCP
ncbi:MAG: hypothetical protein U0228_38840 [Myxococcaceae bacterium]